jgi:quercetin dioxygenase-like cupin family protein
METKPALSEIRKKPVVRDPSALGGAHARSTLNDIERAEAEGMGPPEATTPDLDRHRAREQELKGRTMAFDLTGEASHLFVTPDSAQNARTLAKLDSLRLVLMKLGAGKALERHQASHQMTIQTVSGHVAVHIEGDAPLEAPAGTVIVLERDVQHDVVAKDDSIVLLTVSGPTPQS